MLLGVKFPGVIGQQNRNAVLDGIRLAQARVVEAVIDQQERTAIGRADQDAEQFRVEHVRQGVAGGGAGIIGAAAAGSTAPDPGTGAPAIWAGFPAAGI